MLGCSLYYPLREISPRHVSCSRKLSATTQYTTHDESQGEHGQ